MNVAASSSNRWPWQLADFDYGTGVVALHQEIEHFYSYILPTPTEFLLRADAVKRIEDVVMSLWPDEHCSIAVFGSFRTGLNLPVSDIDIVVTGYWHNVPLYDLQNELIARGVVQAESVNVLDKASVPVVKFTERESQIKFDVAFNVVTGVQAAELILDFKHKFPEMPKLVMVLKQFLALQGLNEVYTGGISSYALTLMCISFLQHQLREAKKTHNNNNKLGVLLLRFLDYYGRRFDYFKYGITVRGDRNCVEKCQLQSTLSGHNWQSVLSIEDPITPTNDIGRSSHAALYVKQVFEAAYMKLTKLVDADSTKVVGSILGSIVEVPQEVISYREWVNNKFQHLVSKNACYTDHRAPSIKSFEHRCYNYGVTCKYDDGLESDESNSTASKEGQKSQIPKKPLATHNGVHSI